MNREGWDRPLFFSVLIKADDNNNDDDDDDDFVSH